MVPLKALKPATREVMDSIRASSGGSAPLSALCSMNMSCVWGSWFWGVVKEI
jgi:hypothetical protein